MFLVLGFVCFRPHANPHHTSGKPRQRHVLRGGRLSRNSLQGLQSLEVEPHARVPPRLALTPLHPEACRIGHRRPAPLWQKPRAHRKTRPWRVSMPLPRGAGGRLLDSHVGGLHGHRHCARASAIKKGQLKLKLKLWIVCVKHKTNRTNNNNHRNNNDKHIYYRSGF